MFHAYHLNRDEWLGFYHERSNGETLFSMVDARFTSYVRSKTPVAQVNEILTKFLCHNLVVLIQSVYELGIDPIFAPRESFDAPGGLGKEQNVWESYQRLGEFPPHMVERVDRFGIN